MRFFLLFLALALGGVAAYYATAGKTSYSEYSSDQLHIMELEFDGLTITGPLNEKLSWSQRMLVAERRRRLILPAAGALAGVFLLGALVAFLRRPRSKALTEEDARLAARLGNPEDALELALLKAAKLLGVARDAPLVVVEAALQAQLAEHDASRLELLGPDLRRLVLEKRDALTKARDLLVKHRP